MSVGLVISLVALAGVVLWAIVAETRRAYRRHYLPEISERQVQADSHNDLVNIDISPINPPHDEH